MATKEQRVALETHRKVLDQTRHMLITWQILICINFVAHFMRMGVSLTYMTSQLGASELNAGVVVTLHMAVIGLANAYLAFSMDTHSFESMITARFALLTVVTLAEWLAQSFLEFAIAYVVASLSIVWMSVIEGYFVRMLPESEAKKLSFFASISGRSGIMLGLALGGCIGGFLSLKSVFFYSFIVSVLSLIFILCFIVGCEKEIKRAQREDIASMYREFPDLFTEPSDRFPLPFLNQSLLIINTVDNDNDNIIMINNNKNDHIYKQPPLKSERDDKIESSSLFQSIKFIPLMLFLINNGFRTTQVLEIIAWWNVYSTQVMNVSIAQSSGQMVLSFFCLAMTLTLAAKLTNAHRMNTSVLLRWSLFVYVISGLFNAALYFCVFPLLSFIWFWVAFPLMFAMNAWVDPFRLSLQVMECPPRQAGSVFAINVFSRAIIPAAQHVIIGALWNIGGSNHPWFFRWFGMLHLISTIIFIAYYIAKKWVIGREESFVMMEEGESASSSDHRYKSIT